MKLEILSKAPYAYGYDVNEYDEYGNPKVFSKHEEKDGYGNLKGKTCEPTHNLMENNITPQIIYKVTGYKRAL